MSNEKVPPAKPVIVAVAPSQVGIISKEESSAENVVNSTVVEVGQLFITELPTSSFVVDPGLVYIML